MSWWDRRQQRLGVGELPAASQITKDGSLPFPSPAPPLPHVHPLFFLAPGLSVLHSPLQSPCPRGLLYLPPLPLWPSLSSRPSLAQVSHGSYSLACILWCLLVCWARAPNATCVNAAHVFCFFQLFAFRGPRPLQFARDNAGISALVGHFGLSDLFRLCLP